MSRIRSNAAEYPVTSAFRPVRLNRSWMYSSSTSQKYSLPLDARNHLTEEASGQHARSRSLTARLHSYCHAISRVAFRQRHRLTRSTSWRRTGTKRWRGRRPLRVKAPMVS